jgi:hypothetical protein
MGNGRRHGLRHGSFVKTRWRFFKRFFLVAAILVLFLSAEFSGFPEALNYSLSYLRRRGCCSPHRERFCDAFCFHRVDHVTFTS